LQAELQRELANLDLTSGAEEYNKYTEAVNRADLEIEKLE
jgi:hypothetical protein